MGFHRESVIRPIIEGFIKQVRFLPGTDRVGVVGFCHGARYAVLAATSPLSGLQGQGVDAAYACHPSSLSVPDDFKDVIVPLSFALGDKDSLCDETQIQQIKDVMADKEKNGIKSQIKVYEDQVHGFALRGDWNNDKDKKAMDDALKQGIDWFNANL